MLSCQFNKCTGLVFQIHPKKYFTLKWQNISPTGNAMWDTWDFLTWMMSMYQEISNVVLKTLGNLSFMQQWVQCRKFFIRVCRLVNLKIDFIPKRPCHHWLPQWGDYYRRDSPEVPEATKSVISIQLIFFSLVKQHFYIKVNGWSHILNFLYTFFYKYFCYYLKIIYK